MDRETFNVISVYAEQVELEEYYKVKFWENLEDLVQDILLMKIFSDRLQRMRSKID